MNESKLSNDVERDDSELMGKPPMRGRPFGSIHNELSNKVPPRERPNSLEKTAEKIINEPFPIGFRDVAATEIHGSVSYGCDGDKAPSALHQKFTKHEISTVAAGKGVGKSTLGPSLYDLVRKIHENTSLGKSATEVQALERDCNSLREQLEESDERCWRMAQSFVQMTNERNWLVKHFEEELASFVWDDELNEYVLKD